MHWFVYIGSAAHCTVSVELGFGGEKMDELGCESPWTMAMMTMTMIDKDR